MHPIVNLQKFLYCLQDLLLQLEYKHPQTPRYNKQYFNTGAVGVGSTQATTVTVTGVTTEISLNPQQIFIRNHNFGTNDKVVYDKEVF